MWNKIWNIISFGIKIAALLCGLALIPLGVEAMQSKSSDWPSVEGQVLSSEHDFSASTNEDVEVTYEYEVNGTRYTSSYQDYSKVARGTKVTVYYDPADPDASTLVPGSPEVGGFLLLAGGLGCIGWSMWGMWKTLKAWATEPKDMAPR